MVYVPMFVKDCYTILNIRKMLLANRNSIGILLYINIKACCITGKSRSPSDNLDLLLSGLNDYLNMTEYLNTGWI